MPLLLNAAASLTPQYRNPYRLSTDVISFNQDLLSPYGMQVDEGLARQGRNITFTELAEHVMRAALITVPAAELLIVAYALPDLHPMKTVASHLNHLFGDRCRSFAISEQGLGAPFTALRIAAAYARSGRCRSLALFVLEQVTLPYRNALVHEHRLADSSVLLFFGSQGSWEVASLRSCGRGDHLAGQLLAAVPDGADGQTLVVAGPWADPGHVRMAAMPCHEVAPGSYCTSVWRELARHHQDWAANYARVVLCDTDPRTGASHIAVFSQRAADPVWPKL
jgi:hypothetical protein